MIFPGTFQGQTDDTVDIEIRRTHRGIGEDVAKDPAARDEEQWVALVREGLVDLGTKPTLGVARDAIRWSGYDEVEVHVLLRVDGGCTLGSLIAAAPFPETDVARATCRLARRGLVRLA